jgi:preprotein translocase subunit SecG
MEPNKQLKFMGFKVIKNFLQQSETILLILYFIALKIGIKTIPEGRNEQQEIIQYFPQKKTYIYKDFF